MLKVLIHYCLVMLLLGCEGVQNNDQNTNVNSMKVPVVFYNVENLFDIYDNPKTLDDEFTPEGEKEWTEERYNLKIEHLAGVLSSVPGEEYPVFIGLAEVENREVLEDLIANPLLSEGKYGIIHHQGIDKRGIEPALLYRKDLFKIKKDEAIRVNFPFNDDLTTRDILHVKGEIEGEEIDVFVNHWSSRREGKEETAPKRLFQAKLLREEVDNILEKDKYAKILILGDFNDTPSDKSLSEVLKANESNQTRTGLFNLHYKKHTEQKGTINYKGKWYMFDQIIVSGGLLNPKDGIRVKPKSGKIFEEDWVLFKHPKYGDLKPNKTYGGDSYYGGYSDHLAVYAELNF